MIDLNLLKLSEYSTPEVKAALAACQKAIAEKPPKTLAAPAFWKAVENRLRLQRELVIRGETDDAPAIALPADRMPLVTIEHFDDEAELIDTK